DRDQLKAERPVHRAVDRTGFERRRRIADRPGRERGSGSHRGARRPPIGSATLAPPPGAHKRETSPSSSQRARRATASSAVAQHSHTSANVAPAATRSNAAASSASMLAWYTAKPW